jgi:hypothetical protein
LAVVVFAALFVFWDFDAAAVPFVILASWTLPSRLVSAFRNGLREPAP